MVLVGYILLGVVAGILSGLMGIGGGIIIIPALVLLFGLTQHQAQGTTLALFALPIGFLGAYTYYKQGYVDMKIAAFIFLGFLLGVLPGAKISTSVNPQVLQRIFGVGLLALSAKMILFP